MAFDLSAYVPVQERIGQFWTQYPTGRIVNRLESMPDDFTMCRYRAEIYRDAGDTEPASTGHAVGIAGAPGPQGASWEETCETSAIGRALATMGYAKSQQDRPSREEMEVAAGRSSQRAGGR